MKTYSGYSADTTKSLVLDAGAFFKNFDVKTDTFASAKQADKLIGATQGGGEFSAVPELRQIEIDGIKGRAKGLEVIDSWEVYLTANVIEVKLDTIKAALCASETATGSDVPAGYTQIKAKNNIELTDYIDNITWVGTLSGSDKPVIIQVYNALSNDGLKLTPTDKSEGVITLSFYGHYDDQDLDNPPFAIFYPSAE